MHRFLKSTAASLAFAALAAGTAQAQAGTTSNLAQVNLSANKPVELAVAINSGGTQSIATMVDGALNNFTGGPVDVTTSWNLTGGTTVSLVGWFATPAAAMSNGTTNIASGRLQGCLKAFASCTAADWAPFTGAAVGTVGVAGGSMTIFSQAVANPLGPATQNSLVNLRLDLTGLTGASAVSAGAYSGVLNLRAVVQ